MRYPFVFPALAAAVGACVALCIAVGYAGRRKLAVTVMLACSLFAAFGWARTYAAHYRWLCVTHHHDMCNNDGDGDPGPSKFGLWMVDHFG